MDNNSLEAELGRCALDWFAKNRDKVLNELPADFEQGPQDVEMPGAPEGSGKDVAVDVGQAIKSEPATMAKPKSKYPPKK